MSYLSADELLAGAAVVHDVEVPGVDVPGIEGPGPGGAPAARVRMRPLTVRDIQRVVKAARDDDALLSVLMLREAMVEPALTIDQVHGLPVGLARHLVDELNRISGLTVAEESVAAAVEAPLARACFVLAREFGWSPQQVGELTMGQVLLYLEMMAQGSPVAAAEAR